MDTYKIEKINSNTTTYFVKIDDAYLYSEKWTMITELNLTSYKVHMMHFEKFIEETKSVCKEVNKVFERDFCNKFILEMNAIKNEIKNKQTILSHFFLKQL